MKNGLKPTMSKMSFRRTIIKGFEVKIRGPNQGLGSIPTSKNEVLGLIPESKKSCCGTNPFRLLVLWSQNSIFLVLGLDPRTRNCYFSDQIISSNPFSSPCRELMGLRKK